MSATMTLLSTVIELAQDSSDADFYDDAGVSSAHPPPGRSRRIRATAAVMPNCSRPS